MTDTAFQKYSASIKRLLVETEKIASEDVVGFQKTNEILFSELLDDNYVSSFANPEYTTECFGQLGPLLSALYFEFRKAIDYGYYRMSDELQGALSLFRKLTKCDFAENSVMDIYTALRILNDSGRAKIENDYTLTDRYYQRVAKLCIEDTRNIFRYNQLISDQDIAFMRYINSYDEDRIKKLSEHIGNMFIHGFFSQGRNPGLRKSIILYYEVGQERIAQHVSAYLKNRSQYDVRIVKVSSWNKVLQYEYDHLHDAGLYLDRAAVENYKQNYQTVIESLSGLLKDQCGRIKIGQFGSLPGSPFVKKSAVTLEGEQFDLYNQLVNITKSLQGKYVSPAEISLCSVTIPNQTIDGEYDEIFEDFYTINTTNSEPFEVLQQILIDELDKACQVEIKGAQGNDTKIRIQFQPLEDVSRQTNFMNCGGDINIPHGELFTTPQLEGTSGLLHFKSVFLKGYHYKDLRLQFTDGFVEEYSCQNFDTLSENREYILNTLFNNTYPMPIGEFSIGTNTAAYAVISKHGILDKLPILLVEKLGPHFAVGDPCYARGEEEKVFNRENGKEIMPKENSQTAKRHSDPDAGYTNVHTDITIPYEDIGFLTAVNHAGNRVDIIKDGLFVLPGLDLLNQPLLAIRG